MKRVFIHLLMVALAGCPTLFIQAQPTLFIPAGQPVALDGTWSTGEWADAVAVTVPAPNTGKVVSVRMKHYQDTLLFTFAGPLESANSLFPEIVIDARYNSQQWQPDDAWFHVSATDCYFFGAPSVYTQCANDHPEWTAFPNMPHGTVYVDTIEIAIPYDLLSLTSQRPDTIGLAVSVTNTVNRFGFWPDNANNGQPTTWAQAILVPDYPSPTRTVASKSLQVFPNPSPGTVQVQWPDDTDVTWIRITDMQGRLHEMLSRPSNTTTSMVQLPGSGSYVLSAQTDTHQWQQVVVVP